MKKPSASLVLSEMAAMGRVKELRVSARIYNNRLRERRERLGLTYAQLADQLGLKNTTSLVSLETMRARPYRKVRVGGRSKWSDEACEWSALALKLAAFYGVEPIELFPQVINDVCQSRVERKFDAEEIGGLPGAVPQALPSPEDFVLAKERTARLNAAVAVLRPREAQILQRRFGLDGDRDETLEEIAADMGVSRDRIRQIEAKALRKLRHPARSKGLVKFW